jgi:hypothetical protein
LKTKVNVTVSSEENKNILSGDLSDFDGSE